MSAAQYNLILFDWDDVTLDLNAEDNCVVFIPMHTELVQHNARLTDAYLNRNAIDALLDECKRTIHALAQDASAEHQMQMDDFLVELEWTLEDPYSEHKSADFYRAQLAGPLLLISSLLAASDKRFQNFTWTDPRDYLVLQTNAASEDELTSGKGTWKKQLAQVDVTAKPQLLMAAKLASTDENFNFLYQNLDFLGTEENL